MEVKQINKRASGQAFELILKPPSPVSEAPRTLASPKKKDVSLDEIQKKLEAAEERRKHNVLSAEPRKEDGEASQKSDLERHSKHSTTQKNVCLSPELVGVGAEDHPDLKHTKIGNNC
ncbi:UNVERIFIED_CONTAM: hypothetical protein K2H54_038015 [Gekko kuhli]